MHGLLTSLSPMKDGKYFVGSIADSTSSIRLVGFSATQQREIAAQHDQKKLVECAIQKSGCAYAQTRLDKDRPSGCTFVLGKAGRCQV